MADGIHSRRDFLKGVCAGTATLGGCALQGGEGGRSGPNVILITADDQGYGDLEVMGNRVIRTPNMDAMARRGTRMAIFYVNPVCAPPRACLMTGRYNYRTRVVDTFVGRTLMDPAEVTLPEILRRAGYAAGIFGKWNLGNNYPLRAMDRMKKACEAWFEDVGSNRSDNYVQPRIYIGTPFENPVVLTRRDWRRFKGRPRGTFSNGRWLLHAASACAYTFKFRFPKAAPSGGRAVLRMGWKTLEKTFPRGARSALFEGVDLERGDLSLEGDILPGGVESGPWKADIRRGKP